MEQIHQRHPKVVLPSEDSSIDALLGTTFLSSNSARMMHLRHDFGYGDLQESIQRYNLDLEKFYLEMENYYKKNWAYEDRVKRTICIRFRLLNEGTVSANEIDLNFSLLRSWHLSDDQESAPFCPNPPIKNPLTAFRELGATPPYINYARLALDKAHEPPLIKGPQFIENAQCHSVKFHIRHLKHTRSLKLPSIYAYIPRDEVQETSIPYSVHAAEMPHMKEGVLTIKLISA